nr:MAG TPA: hypothetical protein [Caudoviricetes sp.]
MTKYSLWSWYHKLDRTEKESWKGSPVYEVSGMRQVVSCGCCKNSTGSRQISRRDRQRAGNQREQAAPMD